MEVPQKTKSRITILFSNSNQRYIDSRLVVAEGVRGGRGLDWKFGISSCRLTDTGWIRKQGPTVERREPYSTSCDKSYVTEYGKECRYVYN